MPAHIALLHVLHTGFSQDKCVLLLVEAKVAAQIRKQSSRVGLDGADGLVCIALHLGPEAGQLAGHVLGHHGVEPLGIGGHRILLVGLDAVKAAKLATVCRFGWGGAIEELIAPTYIGIIPRPAKGGQRAAGDEA
jgi:hypothetical protein